MGSGNRPLRSEKYIADGILVATWRGEVTGEYGLPFHFNDHRESTASFHLDIIVRRVVWNMAVNKPLAAPASWPNHVKSLAGSDIHSIGPVARSFRQHRAIDRNDLKRPAMHMHGMNEVVVGADEAQLYGRTDAHANDVGRGIGLAVDGEVVWQ